MVKQKPVILSYGGGTQSIAICILIAQGRLPKPERIIIADTSRESSETWQYTDRHVSPVLESVNLKVEVAPHSLATVDLYRNGDLLIPAFLAPQGAMPGFCSNEWKERVLRRYLRQQGYGPKKPVEKWLGISLDEVGRAKPSCVKWCSNNWPLLYIHEPALTRSDCIKIVKEAGLPDPPKSSCWHCPYKRNAQWRNTRDNFPEDWEKAVALDAEIRQNPKFSNVYLHDSRLPLDQADLGQSDTPSDPLMGDVAHCDSGYCMV